MAENQEEVSNDNQAEIKKDAWFEVKKWGAVFGLSVLFPIGILLYWTRFNPQFEVFLTISILYLITTVILLKPLVNKEPEK